MSKETKKRDRFGGGRGPNALWLFLLIFLAAIGFLYYYNAVHRQRELIAYSTFVEQIDKGNVAAVEIEGQSVRGELKTPLRIASPDEGVAHAAKYFETYIVAPTTELLNRLSAHEAYIRVMPHDRGIWSFVLLLLPVLLLFAVLFFLLMRQNQGGGSKIFSIGKSKARFFSPNTIKIKFKDVAGVQEAKEDLADIVDFLKNPERFRRIGAKIPRGVLLTGAPGNGKTMLAKAVAGEASCPFFSISGSDFVEVFVGVGASRVRDLFAQARRHAPCIVFIDEIDAVGRHRGVGVGGGNDEREQTLNQLLAEMDGFSTEHGEVIVLAATNRPDVLDKALLRPGRFDRKVEVPYPDLVSREQILRIHSKGVRLDKTVNLETIARGTPRFSGADLANLINESALIAAKKHKKEVGAIDFEEARDKIMVGAERKTLTRTKEELLLTAYHEGGHTLVAIMNEHAYPLHKVTILSRGGTLGATWYLPEDDDVSHSEEQMRAEIMVSLGGRIAEELVYGISKRTSGAHSDFKAATRMARSMVAEYGMSPLGPINFALTTETGRFACSEGMLAQIDEQVRTLVQECYAQAEKILRENRDKLDTLARELFEKETLDAEQVYVLLGLPLPPQKSFSKGSGEDIVAVEEPEAEA